MFTGKWAHFLVKRENVALEIKDSCVGSPTAFPWTPAYVPFWGVSFHMLLKVILALKCFLAYFTFCVLWWSRQTNLTNFPRYHHTEKNEFEYISNVSDAENVMIMINQKTNSSFYCLEVCLNSPTFLYYRKSLCSLTREQGFSAWWLWARGD